MSVVPLPTATLTPPSPEAIDRDTWLAALLADTAADLHAAAVIDEATLTAHRVAALELALGVSMLSLRPTAHGYKTPTDIAQEVGVSAQKVGRAITALELRVVNPGVATRVLTRLDDRWVLGWAYGHGAVQRIKAHLAASRAA